MSDRCKVLIQMIAFFLVVAFETAGICNMGTREAARIVCCKVRMYHFACANWITRVAAFVFSAFLSVLKKTQKLERVSEKSSEGKIHHYVFRL